MLSNDHPLSPGTAQGYAPQTLAYLGDGVYELLVRDLVLRKGNRPHGVLHREATEYVSARGQSDALEKILPLLTEEEATVFRRGRNSDAVGGKNSDVIQYKRATGVEALFGYLFLCGQTRRLEELFHIMWEE